MFDTFVLRVKRRSILAGAIALLSLPILGASTAQAASVEEVKAKGKIIVGIQGDNAPWGFVNSSGVQDGYDADIAKLFAKELGVEVEFAPLAVANRIPALVTGKVDILFATMAMTEERAKSIQYSKPYAGNVVGVVAEKTVAIKAPEDLAGKEVGVPRSSTMDKAITEKAPATATIRRFDDDAATIQALLSGQVQAVGGNQFYPQRLNDAKPDTFEMKFPLLTSYNGVGTRLGERDWNEAVNAFLDKIRANGEHAKVYKKWMALPLPEFPESMPNIPYTVN